MVVVDTPNYSAPPPNMSHHQQNVHVPKFPPAAPPAANATQATGPPVIGMIF